MASQQNAKRKSITGLFENLDITPHASSSETPQTSSRRPRMLSDLRKSISKGWPSMSMNMDKEALSLTIRADDIYREYAQDQDPKKLFEKASLWISSIQQANIIEKQEIITHEINEAMIRAIFGSNMIERAGLGWDITVQLCREIFAGNDVAEIPERNPEYHSKLLDLYRKQQPDLKKVSGQFVLRGRNEIVQHAKAFQHIMNAFVVDKQDLSEDLIKETHKILTHGVPITHPDSSDVLPEEYGGIYRTIPVHAGETNFAVPRRVPLMMKRMCEELKSDLAKADTEGKIDPFSIAAKYSLEFVQIHPFLDGNGRTCRMILNVILCRYAGVIIPIGEKGEERAEYMNIKKRASVQMEGHGEYATFVLKRSITRLQAMKKKLAGKKTTKGEAEKA